MTDLPVPRPPAMTTPPMSGLTAARSSAVLIGVWPTTSDRGKACFATLLCLYPVPSSAAIAAAARSSAQWGHSSQDIMTSTRGSKHPALNAESMPSLDTGQPELAFESIVPVIDHDAAFCTRNQIRLCACSLSRQKRRTLAVTVFKPPTKYKETVG